MNGDHHIQFRNRLESKEELSVVICQVENFNLTVLMYVDMPNTDFLAVVEFE